MTDNEQVDPVEQAGSAAERGAAVHGVRQTALQDTHPIALQDTHPIAPEETDPAVVAVIDQVRAGRLSVEQAVERLVDDAVAAVADTLSPEQRQDLRSILRETIAADPTLSALANEIGVADVPR